MRSQINLICAAADPRSRPTESLFTSIGDSPRYIDGTAQAI